MGKLDKDLNPGWARKLAAEAKKKVKTWPAWLRNYVLSAAKRAVRK